MQYIYYWWMILLFYYTYVVWRLGKCESQARNLYVNMWNVITGDVNVYDNIDMRWCWWYYWDEMTLILMIISISDDAADDI